MEKLFTTERLNISFMDESDAELLFELDQDPAVMKYINGGKVSSWQSIKKVMIPRLNAFSNFEKGWGLWKVEERANGCFIGWVLVRPMDFFSDNPKLDDLELGWRFKQQSWGKGFATEAANAIKNQLTQRHGIRKFSAIALPENTDSIRVMDKLGMAYIKTGIHKDPLGDCEVVYYSVDV